MDSTEEQLRAELSEAFGRASYPLIDPFELVPVLPDGPATEFEAGDTVIPAVELGTKYGEALDFPYESVDPLVDDVVEALADADEI